MLMSFLLVTCRSGRSEGGAPSQTQWQRITAGKTQLPYSVDPPPDPHSWDSEYTSGKYV